MIMPQRLRIAGLKLRSALLRTILLRQVSLTRSIKIALILSVGSLLCLAYYVTTTSLNRLRVNQEDFFNLGKTKQQYMLSVPCASHNLRIPLPQKSSSFQSYKRRRRQGGGELRRDLRVLVLTETQYSPQGRAIVTLLESARFLFKAEMAWRALPQLTRADRGRFGAIVFENFATYLSLDRWNRRLLDKYCQQFRVGVVAFMPGSALASPQLRAGRLGHFPVRIFRNLSIHDYYTSLDSDMLRIVRRGRHFYDSVPLDDWTVFQSEDANFEPVAFAAVSKAAIRFLMSRHLRRKRDTHVDNTAGEDMEAQFFSEGEAETAKLSSSNSQTQARPRQEFDSNEHILMTTILHDHGHHDGIQRVLFGHNLTFWLHTPLFLDALARISQNYFSLPLLRNLLIDVDDVFVGRQGIRLRPDDVEAMLATQTRWAEKYVSAFRFNLGFSGKFYQRGSAEENLGDAMLIAQALQFYWFPHMWRHTKPHTFSNQTRLRAEMQSNLAFAESHGLPTNSQYAVAPHHSGVYPVFEPLYSAWKEVWNISVTSTEEYPHFKPARFRKGFIYRGIKVLPRQTCGIYTHTLFLDKYPAGRATLDSRILGGEIFQSLLFNPIAIYMTHMSNYGSDRLAYYVFNALFEMVHCWTNLKLRWTPPRELAAIYFKTYPNYVVPVWQDPCRDRRHRMLWRRNEQLGEYLDVPTSTNITVDSNASLSQISACPARLPHAVLLGPQKTGSTALWAFLKAHPRVKASLSSRYTFEEVQFFLDTNYRRGLDWYLDQFPHIDNYTSSNQLNSNQTSFPKQLLFEKSANYFDGELVASRVAALLPDALFLVTIIDPALRAYSWYQHQRARRDPTALKYSFDQLVAVAPLPVGFENDTKLHSLRSRCLVPGFYANHLERWLRYFKYKQILLLDGDQLRTDPFSVMDRVQKFLNLSPILDYRQLLRFVPQKNFFCLIVRADNFTTPSSKSQQRRAGQVQCLGASKGRRYEPMSGAAAHRLRHFYLKHNVALVKLIKRFGFAEPTWLRNAL